jgi:hypothetical protein
MNNAAAQTLLDSLRDSLELAVLSPDGIAAPIAVLWTDVDGQWQPLIPMLAKLMPQLYALGTYAPDDRIGPVIWLRCVVERSVPNSPSRDVIPVLYLPKVNRQDLRAGGDCPRELQPLIELQFRGAVWHQRNGRDWTVDAFASSEFGCGLNVSADGRTQASMLRALPYLGAEPLAHLRGRQLDAEDFDRLAVGDPNRDLLSWMSDPKTFEAHCEAARWQSFRDVCRRQFGIDPDTDGPHVANDMLLNMDGSHKEKWLEVWRRFCEAPKVYPGISRCLRDARPRGLFVDRSRQPAENTTAEEHLRRDLERAGSLVQADACNAIHALEAQHGERRAWVWAQLGESPLTMVLHPLAQLATSVRGTLNGASVHAFAADYAAQGWRSDRAAMEALNCSVTSADGKLIARVVRALYEPWLDRVARRFQELVSATDATKLAVGVQAEKDCCVLFTDGLRFDVGVQLHETLEARGFRSRLSHRIAPLPTVTATAKPMASPANGAMKGVPGTEDFTPVFSKDGKPVVAQRLRDVLSAGGVDVIAPDDIRFPSGTDSGGWSEIGRLDELGHSMEIRVVSQIRIEVEAIADRIGDLLNAGWKKVRVVTDHGWLLLPGGLPKIELPAHLVASRWARCATVRGESSTDVPTYPWFWNSQVRIASPPGIGSFVANAEYAHGGVSPQECVVPELVVERGATSVSSKIVAMVWRGMRCKVTLTSAAPGFKVDLRLNWKQAGSSIAASAKEVVDNEANLICADDHHEGSAATIVLLDDNGNVVDYRPTTVGEGK